MKQKFSTHTKMFLIKSFLVSFFISAIGYSMARLMMYEIPFSFFNDSIMLLKVTGSEWLMVIIIGICWRGLHYFMFNTHKDKPNISFILQRLYKLLCVALFFILLTSCNAQQTGVKKDFNTGMVTRYKSIVPAGSRIIMNGETLNHTQIPLGEKFIVVNENIKGLVVKNGKVSVGCSLMVTDKKGNKMLAETDLFKNNDVFDAEKIKYLQCTVSTGKPMDWDEQYNVDITFWDKYGTGSIRNELPISIIDIP